MVSDAMNGRSRPATEPERTGDKVLRRTLIFIIATMVGAFAAAQGATERFELPGEDVYPEGIAYGAGSGAFYTGSSTDGTIFRGDARTGGAEVWLSGDDEATLDAAYGMALDRRGRLWVAGGPTGEIAVYDTGSGELVRRLETPEADDTFLNDVVTAGEHAYVTDSSRPTLFRIAAGEEVGEVEAWLDLSDGPIEYQSGEFLEGVNLNGIVATSDGSHLITVDMNDGRLYRIDTDTREITPIDLGDETVRNGDGLVLDGRTLYVVRIAEEEIVTIGLEEDLAAGRVESRFEDPSFTWPATAARAGDRLLVVNTQFNRQEEGDPELPFTVSSVPVSTVEAGGRASSEDTDASQEGGDAEEQQEGEEPNGGPEGQDDAQREDEPQEDAAEDGEQEEGEDDEPQDDEPQDDEPQDDDPQDDEPQEDEGEEQQAEGAEGGIADYRSVTDDLLENPEPGDWLMWLRSYESWSYSPLDQITPDNVHGLRPVWSFSTGVREGHEAPPIVNDGVMFVSAPENKVIALEAATGDLLWRYERDLPHDLTQLHPTNRGVALYGDAVYLATLDAYLVALDARTGEVLWERLVEDYDRSYYMTLAPLVADGKVMVGVSGGEFGVRGFVQAFDAETGDPAWKAFTIPAPGEPGNETWPGNTWQYGGAPVWMTGSYDAELGIAYWGTGNAAPWVGEARPGDNLYSTSVVALDVSDGAIVGHHQYHHNDSWDWDEVATPMLIDFERDGRTVSGLVHAARNGYLWFLERSAAGIDFVDAEPYVFQNVFESVDPDTGRPTYDEDHKPGIDNEANFCPSLWGGKDWPPAAFNPETRYLYIPANENLCGFIEGVEQEYVAGQTYFGANNGLYVREGAEHVGELQAWDVDTGEEVWTHRFADSHNWGPVMTTGGGLVFMGGTNDRNFHAFDAETGELVWQYRTNSGVMGVPVSFEVDGTQYVAVLAGWGVDAVRMQNAVAEELGGQWDIEVPQGGVVWVFALDEADGEGEGDASEGEDRADP